MVNQCRHIRTSGTQCGMAAMRSQNFCYYHQNCPPRPRRAAVRSRPHTQTPIPTYDYGAIPVAASRDAGAPGPASGTWVQRPEEIQPPVQLLFPEDRASIQINLYRIAVAQAENRIDTRTANSMTWNQQVSMPISPANRSSTPRPQLPAPHPQAAMTKTPTPQAPDPHPSVHASSTASSSRPRETKSHRPSRSSRTTRSSPSTTASAPACSAPRSTATSPPRRAPPRLPVRPLRRSRGLRAQGTGLRIQSRAQRSTLSHNSQRCHPERSTPRVRSRRICCR